MIARLIATTILLVLAFSAFWGNVLESGSLLNPFGILFLFLAGVTRLKWETVREVLGSRDPGRPTIDVIAGQIRANFGTRGPQRHSSSY